MLSNKINLRLIVTFLILAICALQANATTFVDWPDVNTTTSTMLSASLFGIDFDVDVTVQAGTFVDNDVQADGTAFLNLFPADVPTLFYQATSGSGGSDITSSYTFSTPLPAGSRLLALDLDGFGEQMTLSSGGSALTLLTQLESQAGATSLFPTYNSTTSQLTATTTSGNDFEVSVFDVSGLSSLAINYQGGSFNGGSFVAIALVPEPSSCCLAVGLSCLLVNSRRRKSIDYLLFPWR